jgi:hypothetical protein
MEFHALEKVKLVIRSELIALVRVVLILLGFAANITSIRDIQSLVVA